MRPLSQLEMHRRKHGKGSGTDTFDIRFGHSRHAPARMMTVHVEEIEGWKRLRISLNLNRKPTTEEIERIRTLFFHENDTVIYWARQENRDNYADLWEPSSPITPP